MLRRWGGVASLLLIGEGWSCELGRRVRRRRLMMVVLVGLVVVVVLVVLKGRGLMAL